MTMPSRLAVDIEGVAAPPRSNGELTFDAPWQGRAFALCLAVLGREGLTWSDFRPFLVEALAEADDEPYYDRFVVALERFVASLDLLAR